MTNVLSRSGGTFGVECIQSFRKKGTAMDRHTSSVKEWGPVHSTDRQTNKQTADSQTATRTDVQRGKRNSMGQTFRQISRKTDSQTVTQIDKQTNRWKDCCNNDGCPFYT